MPGSVEGVGGRRSPVAWFDNRGIKTKMLSAVVLMGLVAAVVGALALARISDLNDHVNEMQKGNVERLVGLADMRAAMADMNSSMVTVFSAGVPAAEKAKAMNEVRAATGRMDAAFAGYRGNSADNAVWSEKVASFDSAWTRYKDLQSVFVLNEKPRPGVSIPTELTAVYAEFNKVIAQFKGAMNDLAEVERTDTLAITGEVNDDYDTSVTMLITVTVLGLLIAVGLSLAVARRVVRPLARVSDALSGMADGDLTRHVEVGSTDEVGRMAAALNRATENMRSNVVTMDRSASSLADASGELTTVSDLIAATAAEASGQSDSVAVSAAQVSGNVQTVAAGAEEMGASIREISHNATSSRRAGDRQGDRGHLQAGRGHPGRHRERGRGDRRDRRDHRADQRLPAHHRLRGGGADRHGRGDEPQRLRRRPRQQRDRREHRQRRRLHTPDVRARGEGAARRVQPRADVHRAAGTGQPLPHLTGPAEPRKPLSPPRREGLAAFQAKTCRSSGRALPIG
ncbi:methyl-accepting chemotaxis protein [Spirillospora albida]|uniref:methyl-accepting chemotaxis protein n=1 Tax=Spirillospora albida TaxID=58123 RepID=UPI0004C0C46B|nr:methyl-accepting chemotaxis protein [Spirillospora albida]